MPNETMTLDITRPDHREALRWACNWAAYDPAFLVRVIGSEDALENPDTRDNALAARALSSPSDSAAIVRAELERCGVSASVQRTGQPALDWDALVWIWWTPEAEDGPAYLTFSCKGDTKTLRYGYNVPALVLRLLVCTTKEGAIAALREVGR